MSWVSLLLSHLSQRKPPHNCTDLSASRNKSITAYFILFRIRRLMNPFHAFILAAVDPTWLTYCTLGPGPALVPTKRVKHCVKAPRADLKEVILSVKDGKKYLQPLYPPRPSGSEPGQVSKVDSESDRRWLLHRPSTRGPSFNTS